MSNRQFPTKEQATQPMNDRRLPVFNAPTITLYRNDLIAFNESFNEALSFVEIITGMSRFAQVDLARWIVEQDDEEMMRRALEHAWFKDTLAFFSLLVYYANREDDE